MYILKIKRIHSEFKQIGKKILIHLWPYPKIKHAMRTINTKDFCKKVTNACNKEGCDIVPEQTRLALGGISNLYFELCLNHEVPYIKVSTESFFESEQVNVELILEEIENCTGIDRGRSIILRDKMKNVLYDILVADPEIKKWQFDPLGEFKINNLEPMQFQFTYEDPAADYYDRFLLSK